MHRVSTVFSKCLFLSSLVDRLKCFLQKLIIVYQILVTKSTLYLFLQ